jgi:hypothetical protein
MWVMVYNLSLRHTLKQIVQIYDYGMIHIYYVA